MKKIGVLLSLVIILLLGMPAECMASEQKSLATEVQNLKGLIQKELEKEFGEIFQEDWELVDGSAEHTGILDCDNDTINCYKDGDKVLVLLYSGSGMSQYWYNEIYSVDSGTTWEEPVLLHGTSSRTDIYFVNDIMIMADGIGMFKIPNIKYKSDWTEEFKTIEINEITQIAELPVMSNGLIDVSFSDPDPEKNQITMQWYPLYEDTSDYLYKMTLNLTSLEKISEDDRYGLQKMAKYYAETGFIYPDSSQEYLNEIELNAKYLKLMKVLKEPDGIKRELRCAINEIYARKGYDFADTDHEDYFAEKDWYKPIFGKQISEEELNVYEKANIDLLVKIEKEVEKADEAI